MLPMSTEERVATNPLLRTAHGLMLPMNTEERVATSPLLRTAHGLMLPMSTEERVATNPLSRTEHGHLSELLTDTLSQSPLFLSSSYLCEVPWSPYLLSNSYFSISSSILSAISTKSSAVIIPMDNLICTHATMHQLP